MYMRRKDFASYCYVIHKLGLKDVYAEIVSIISEIIWGYQLQDRAPSQQLPTMPLVTSYDAVHVACGRQIPRGDSAWTASGQ